MALRMLSHTAKHLYFYLLRRRKFTTKLIVIFVALFFLQSAISMVFTSMIYVKDANAYAIKVEPDQLRFKDPSVTEPSGNGQGSEGWRMQIPKTTKRPTKLTGPILTLITTFKDIPKRWYINTRTIEGWSKLEGIQPVMYTELGEGTRLAAHAEAHGWLVYPAPSVRYGYPILRDMFLHATAHVRPQTLLIGYANSDILFTPDLTDTLSFLAGIDGEYLSQRGLLISGKRINTLIMPGQGSQEFRGHHLSRISQVLFDTADAIDYFITTRGGYPWQQVPDFVIGKPGYDNWLVKKAVDWDLLSIDTSLTVSALHQTENMTHPDKGWLSKDVCMNRDLVDNNGYFPYYMGRTSCMKYFTVFANSTDSPPAYRVELYQRQALTLHCYPPLNLPIIGVLRYNTCHDLAITKTVDTEKYKDNMKPAQS